MKIFNRGNDAKPSGPSAAVAAVAPPPPVAPAVAPLAPTPAPEAAAPPAAPQPDLANLLDANVKEMSEKIARLASSLESAQQERSGFEAKIEQMEERMRKLSSLTEMVSAQYNPFVGDAPTERAEMPRPEVGLAPPPMATPPPELAPPPALSAMLEPPAPELAALPPLAPALEPPQALAEEAPPAAQPAPGPYLPHAEPPQHEGAYLWSVPTSFESSMLLLGWADMLLKTAGSREGLLALVDYYHNLGWIGDPARDQVLAYASGLAAPEGGGSDWRADVQVHERSLLFVEKLRAVGSRRPG